MDSTKRKPLTDEQIAVLDSRVGAGYITLSDDEYWGLRERQRQCEEASGELFDQAQRLLKERDEARAAVIARDPSYEKLAGAYLVLLGYCLADPGFKGSSFAKPYVALGVKLGIDPDHPLLPRMGPAPTGTEPQS